MVTTCQCTTSPPPCFLFPEIVFEAKTFPLLTLRVVSAFRAVPSYKISRFQIQVAGVADPFGSKAYCIFFVGKGLLRRETKATTTGGALARGTITPTTGVPPRRHRRIRRQSRGIHSWGRSCPSSPDVSRSVFCFCVFLLGRREVDRMSNIITTEGKRFRLRVLFVVWFVGIAML